jgi:hypothetical protein
VMSLSSTLSPRARLRRSVPWMLTSAVLVVTALGNGASPAGAAYARPALLIRPVICIAGPQKDPVTTKSLPTRCPTVSGPPMATPAPNSGAGVTFKERLDPALAAFATTSPTRDYSYPEKIVLLPVVNNAKQRYLLGPAVFELYPGQGHTIVRCSSCGGWLVTIHLGVNKSVTMDQSRVWDQVARANLHRMLAFDLNGVVLTAPWIEPTTAAFHSFGGVMQFTLATKSQAAALVAGLR